VLLVVVLAVAALAALDVLSGRPGSGPTTGSAPGTTVPTPTLRATAVNAPPLAPATARASSPRPTVPAIDPESGLRTVRAAALPKAAQLVLDQITAGGPFRYAEDGSTFHNLEGLLPRHGDGYYREYTVETPGSQDRGPRRIVAGSRGERYWTDDHYASFRRIVP
jgi:ribonuclease T1